MSNCIFVKFVCVLVSIKVIVQSFHRLPEYRRCFSSLIGNGLNAICAQKLHENELIYGSIIWEHYSTSV